MVEDLVADRAEGGQDVLDLSPEVLLGGGQSSVPSAMPCACSSESVLPSIAVVASAPRTR